MQKGVRFVSRVAMVSVSNKGDQMAYAWYNKYLRTWMSSSSEKGPQFFFSDRDPTNNDNAAIGYGRHSRWLNTTTKTEWINTTGGNTPTWITNIGAKGDKGDTGDIGPQGIQGVQGEAGPQGLKGDKGDTGLQGPQGDAGIQGIQGEIGSQGLQGVQGVKGDRGDVGPQGVPGPGQTHITIFNVMDYGAIGDGVHDDTQAIKDCIQAAYPAPHNPDFGEQWGAFNWYNWQEKRPTAQGARVIFPKGIFRITETIPIRGFVQLFGQGTATVIKANLPANTTSGAFATEVDSVGLCSGSLLSDMDIWTEYGHGIDLSKGMLGGAIRNVNISAAGWGIYMPDNAYIQGCLIERVLIRQLGNGGARLVGNKNRVVELTIGSNGYRPNVDRTKLEGLLVVKGGGWKFDQLHIESGFGVKCIKVGGKGPTYAGYRNAGIVFDNMWLENEGDTTTNIVIELEDIYGLQMTNSSFCTSGYIYAKNITNVNIDNFGNKVIFAPDDLVSKISIGSVYDQWGFYGDRSEERVVVKDITDQYFGTSEVVPQNRWGNIFFPNPVVTPYGSGATLTYENIPNIGWCWKLKWTSVPNNNYQYIDITLGAILPVDGVVDARTNLFLSCILDWKEFIGQIGFFYGFGNKLINQARWSKKGPVHTEFISCSNLNNATLLRVFTSQAATGEVYFKDLAITVGGRFQPPPAPAKFISYSDGPKHFYSSAPPTTGTWVIGSICYNSAPSLGKPIGWSCTQTGSPGIWQGFGTI